MRPGILRRKATTLASAATLLAAGVLAVFTPGTAQAADPQTCDIYANGGTPCIGAHSTTRALFSAYGGPLYQVQRSSDKQYSDIAVLAAGGVVNAAAQDT